MKQSPSNSRTWLAVCAGAACLFTLLALGSGFLRDPHPDTWEQIVSRHEQDRVMVALWAGSLLGWLAVILLAAWNRRSSRWGWLAPAIWLALELLVGSSIAPNAKELLAYNDLEEAVHNEQYRRVETLIQREHPSREVLEHFMLDAALGADTQFLRILLRHGVPANSWSSGRPILIDAIRRGKVEAVTLLLESGAEVNAPDKLDGQTPLIWAVRMGEPRIVAVLVRHGADVRTRDRSGATALDWAKREHDQAAAKLLRDAQAVK